jgi:hypothetical protein
VVGTVVGRSPIRASGDTGQRRRSSRGGGFVSTLGELSAAGLRTATRFAFPLILALLVVAFLAVQSRIDRNDPKLRLAPIDSKHDLVSFV